MGATPQKKGCAFCGASKSVDGGPLSQCKQCNMAAYCGEEHQHFDWKRHKPLCKTVQSQLSRSVTATATATATVPLPTADGSRDCKFEPSGLSDLAALVAAKGFAFGTEPGAIQLPSSPSLSNDELLPLNVAPKYKKTCSGERSCERLISTGDPDFQIVENITVSGRVPRKRLLQMNCTRPRVIDHSRNPIFTTTLQEHLKALAASGLTLNQQQAIALRLTCIAEHVIKYLTEYGWAVVDNFLGQNHCYHIHREMNYLYNSGIFAPGQLMETKADLNSQDIRSDEIYWFDSTDERVSNAVTVRLLISMIDSIIVHFNGRTSYKISGRSRAMLAIYPSNGTHYVKHIDNPAKDGRCVTSIYYCNQNWNAQKDGGCFRLFPETSDVPLDIEPRGDRLVFLWSDRRNPHEVRPVYRDRYAITIWYFDADEKLAAMARTREQQQQRQDVMNDGTMKNCNKQQLQNVLFTDEQASQLQPSPLKCFTKLESDELSSHDNTNLPNKSNIFTPTVSHQTRQQEQQQQQQQPLRAGFEPEQIVENGNDFY